MTNESLNTASPSNEVFSSSRTTFDETRPATFAEMQGTFDNPFAITNESLNTSSMTNESIS